jgi:hypothetical protein
VHAGIGRLVVVEEAGQGGAELGERAGDLDVGAGARLIRRRKGEQPEAEAPDRREVGRRRRAGAVVGRLGGPSPPQIWWNAVAGDRAVTTGSTRESETNTALPSAS